MLIYDEVWRRRLAVLLAVALLAGVALLAQGRLGGGDDSSKARPAPSAARAERAAEPEVGPPPGRRELERVEAGLRLGVEQAAALGGRAEAAAMLAGWEEPLTATSGPPGPSWMRMWSMSKVATTIALLRELGWGERAGRPVSAELAEALEGAIVRSENCRQRRIVLELQRLAGSPAATRADLASVLHSAGAEARVGTQIETPEALCLPYLESLAEIDDPLVPALLLGTSTWRVEDAVRLVQALGEGIYGEAISRRVLGLMRLAKQPSREVAEGELTAPLDWGAGRTFAGLSPAYKAGWGGALDDEFMAGQIALVTLPGGERLALAAMFHPRSQPSRDDPGVTAAPAALETIMAALGEAIGHG